MSPLRRLASSARWFATSSAYRSTMARDFQPFSRIRSPSDPPDFSHASLNVPELMWHHARIPGLLGPADQHLADPGSPEPPAPAGAQPHPVQISQWVKTPSPQVYGQSAGAGRGEHHQAALARGTRALQRHEAEEGILDHIRGKGVHDHAEQFRPADSLAAQDANDGVIAGGLEIPCPPASGDL
jgi:hypothetical protein